MKPKPTYRELEKKAAFFQTLADNSYDWEMFVDLAGEIKYISPSCELISGYSANEFIENPKLLTQIVHQSDKEIVDNHYDKKLKHTAKTISLAYRIITKNGNIKWIEHNCKKAFDKSNKNIGYSSSNRDITERQNEQNILIKTEKKLSKAENRYRKMFENMKAGVAIYLPVENGNDFIFLDFNRTAEKITNTLKSKVIGKTLLSQFPNMNKTPFFKALQTVNETNKDIFLPAFHYEDTQREGWRENYIYKLSTGEIIAIFDDVTNLKNDEIELQNKNKELIIAIEKAEESEDKFKKLSNLTFEGIVLHQNGIAIDVNLSFAQLFGYTREEVIGKNVVKLIIKEEYHNIISQNIIKNYALPYELVGIKKDGTELPLEVEARDIESDDKTTRVAAVRVISERKKFEQNLIESKNELKEKYNQLNLIMESGNIGWWDWDITSGDEVYNNILPKLLEYEVDEIKPHISWWKNKIHHLDLKQVDFDLQEHFEGKTDFYINEHRLKTKSNKWKWFLDYGKVIERDKDGQPKRMIGTLRVIEQQKNTEKELQEAKEHAEESEERFRNLFENNPVSLWEEDFSITQQILTKKKTEVNDLKTYLDDNPDFVADVASKTIVINVNKVSLQLFKVKSKEELIGKLGKTFNKKSFETYKRLLVSLAENKYKFSEETEYTKFDGEIIPAILNVISTDSHNSIVSITDITERKIFEQELIKAKEKAEESEEKLRTIIETSPDGITITSLEAKVEYVSQQIFNILGYDSAKEMIGRNLMEFIHPDDHPKATHFINEMLNGNLTGVAEYLVIRKDGSTSNIEANANILRDINNEPIGMLMIVRDITERKLAEVKLSQSTQLLEASQSIAKLGGWELDIASNNLFWTDETYRIHDTSPAEFNPSVVAGLSFFLPESSRIISEALKVAIDKGEGFDLELETLTTKGRLISVRITCEVTRKEGRSIKLTGIFKDITEQKEAENKIKGALIKATESDRLKSAFLANMSHEIRTPMNGILGFAGLLKTPDLTGEKQQEYVNIIEKGGTRMLNIINDIVSISMIESGQMKVSIKESNINEQIEYIYNFFKLEVEEKGMKLSLSNSLPLSAAIINTDRKKVFSILTNLVKNAIKYSKEGEIKIGYVLKGNYIEFYVNDTGIGIPKDRQEAIFERFIQSDIEDAMARQGAGLGLSISKAYTEMLGGKIWVESEEGVGSTFYFTLPYTANSEEILQDNDFVSNKVEYNNIQNLKILIAEDDEPSEMLISIIVNEFCTEPLKAKTGREAVELCRNNSDINLLLMDIRMPDMNGYEATRQIREFNKDVIIIAQTAFGLKGDREKSIEAGCNEYISKPIIKDKLLSLIQKYFKEKIS